MSKPYLRRKPRPWTAQEVELAMQLLDDPSAGDSVTIRLLGRTRQACRDKMNRIRNNDGPATQMRNLFGAPPSLNIPPEVIEDRNRRLMAERSLTAVLMGDPIPGYSALERRA